jgi:AcrR family transcriptional regulator
MPAAKRLRRRAKQDRARETVGVILEAAARVLMARGYAAATTNRIADTAGVSIGTIYEYFANKEEIFDALIRREIESLVTAIAGQAPGAGDPVDGKLARLLTAAMGAMRFGPGLYRALEQVPHASFRSHLSAARGGVVALVRGILEQHRAELRVEDLDLAAFLVVSAAEGVAANASDEVFDERLARELASLIRAYLVSGDRPAS